MLALRGLLPIGVCLIAALALCGIGDYLFTPLDPRTWMSPGSAIVGVFSFQTAAIAMFFAIAWPVWGPLRIADRKYAGWAALSAGILTALAALLLADVLLALRGAFEIIAESTAQAGDDEYLLLVEHHWLEIRGAFVLFFFAQIQWIYAVQPDDAIPTQTLDKVRWVVDLIGRCLIVTSLVLVWRGSTGAAEVTVSSGAVPPQAEFAYGAWSFSASYFPLVIGLLCLATGCVLTFAGTKRESKSV